jgi:hypothetical protein
LLDRYRVSTEEGGGAGEDERVSREEGGITKEEGRIVRE